MITPVVSLLVAMRNEEKCIERCLRSIMAQDYPLDRLDVLVLDGESDDSSAAIVRKLIQGKPSFRLLTNPQRFQGLGWNLGIEESRGDIIGIVSAHPELSPSYVRTAVETLLRTRADMVGGPMRARGLGIVGRAVAAATSSRFGVGGARFHYATREADVDTVYMGLCRREVYERIGGFDPEMVRNQDDELSYRLRKHGGRIVCNPEIASYYENRATFKSLFRQYFEYGQWKVRVMQKHPAQMQARHFVPAAFVAALGASAVASLVTPLGRVAFSLIGGSYVLANLCTSAAIAGREKSLELLALLPPTFATLHVAYGVGSLTGLWRFRRPRSPAGSAPSVAASRQPRAA